MQLPGLFAILASLASVYARQMSPVAKVLDLLANLETKVISEGVAAKKTYVEFTEWCSTGAKNLAFEIKTAKSEIEELKASIAEQTSIAGSLTAKVDELTAAIAGDESDLKSATKIRGEEATQFAAEEKELVETVSMLERAVGILEREMRKGGASALQLKNAGSLTTGLSALVQASVLTTADANMLTALVQSTQDAADASDDLELGAPAAAVYEGHSHSIIDTLEDLHEKAEAQLADIRKQEMNAAHAFSMLKQNLEDQMKFNNGDLSDAKKGMAVSAEKKAAAEGDLAVTSKDLAEDTKTLANTKQDCMTRSQDYEAATKSREEELEALKAAKKAIAESTGGSDALTYGLNQVSLLQLSRSRLDSQSDLVNFEAVRLVRDLGRRLNAPALSQLAARMAAAMRMHSSAADPFEKVRGLIADMIERLESEASGDANHKAYCDKELAESNTKKSELDASTDKLTTKIDSMKARSAQLKEESAELQKALAELASSRAEAGKIRREEKAAFVKGKADMQQGLEGVKLALKILREYYSKDAAHSTADGDASGIVGLLEVVESDFSKGLAEMMATEENAAASYKKAEQDSEISKVSKEQDLKYKSKEAVELDKSAAELSTDLAGTKAEAGAVVEYLAKLEEMCVAKPETYEARTQRREAEISGLKEALKILEGTAVLLQRQVGTASLRGVRRHLGA